MKLINKKIRFNIRKNKYYDIIFTEESKLYKKQFKDIINENIKNRKEIKKEMI